METELQTILQSQLNSLSPDQLDLVMWKFQSFKKYKKNR